MIALFILFVSVSFGHAAEITDQSESCRLTVVLRDDRQPIPGVVFRIYYAASVSARGDFIPAEKFASCHINWDIKNADTLRDTALTLAGYAALDGIEPVCSGVTDENGAVSFPGEDAGLLPGVYLVTADNAYIDNRIYAVSPALLTLPQRNEANAGLTYDVTVTPKFDYTEAMSEGKTINCDAVKIWNDNDDKAGKRPEHITVVLLKDGEVYDKVLLNKENNWQYTWEKLSAASCWIAVEERSSYYQVLVHREKNTFVIRNTPVDEREETTTSGGENSTGPSESDTAPSEATSAPDVTSPVRRPERKPKEKKLPDTGVPILPVPILSACGMLFFLIGWGLLRECSYRENEEQ